MEVFALKLNISQTSYSFALKLSFILFFFFQLIFFARPMIIVSNRLERADTKGSSLKVETVVAPLKRYLTYLFIKKLLNLKRTFILLKLTGPGSCSNRVILVRELFKTRQLFFFSFHILNFCFTISSQMIALSVQGYKI